MSKLNSNELRSEYSQGDLGKGVRGKYLNDFNSGSNLVLLDPDVASKFDSEKSVNDALRSLIKLSHKSVRKSKRSISGKSRDA